MHQFIDLAAQGSADITQLLTQLDELTVEPGDRFLLLLAGRAGLAGSARPLQFRDAALRTQVMTDEHAPGEYRAATVRNVDAWYQAFNVKPGEKLFLPPDDNRRIVLLHEFQEIGRSSFDICDMGGSCIQPGMLQGETKHFDGVFAGIDYGRCEGHITLYRPGRLYPKVSLDAPRSLESAAVGAL